MKTAEKPRKRGGFPPASHVLRALAPRDGALAPLDGTLARLDDTLAPLRHGILRFSGTTSIRPPTSCRLGRCSCTITVLSSSLPSSWRCTYLAHPNLAFLGLLALLLIPVCMILFE